METDRAKTIAPYGVRFYQEDIEILKRVADGQRLSPTQMAREIVHLSLPNWVTENAIVKTEANKANKYKRNETGRFSFSEKPISKTVYGVRPYRDNVEILARLAIEREISIPQMIREIVHEFLIK
jgi:hypothetical protein